MFNIPYFRVCSVLRLIALTTFLRSHRVIEHFDDPAASSGEINRDGHELSVGTASWEEESAASGFARVNPSDL